MEVPQYFNALAAQCGAEDQVARGTQGIKTETGRPDKKI
jgi:hypothetical protein